LTRTERDIRCQRSRGPFGARIDDELLRTGKRFFGTKKISNSLIANITTLEQVRWKVTGGRRPSLEKKNAVVVNSKKKDRPVEGKHGGVAHPITRTYLHSRFPEARIKRETERSQGSLTGQREKGRAQLLTEGKK